MSENQKSGRGNASSAAEVYRRAVDCWGCAPQVDMAIEEMAELTTALMHARRGRDANIAEEIADVRIMLAQLELIFRCSEEVDRIKKEKIERLAERILSKEE